MKRLVFDLAKIPFLKRLIGISRSIVVGLNDQEFFRELNLADWFSSYVQFCSGGHFSERAEAVRQWGIKVPRELTHGPFARHHS